MTEHQTAGEQRTPTDARPSDVAAAEAQPAGPGAARAGTTGAASANQPAKPEWPAPTADRPATRRRRLALTATALLAVALVVAGGIFTYHRLHPARPADGGVTACGSAGPLAAVRADGGADVPQEEAVRVGTLFKNSRYADLREHGVNVVGLALRIQQYRPTNQKLALLYANSLPAEVEALRAACSAHGAALR